MSTVPGIACVHVSWDRKNRQELEQQPDAILHTQQPETGQRELILFMQLALYWQQSKVKHLKQPVRFRIFANIINRLIFATKIVACLLWGKNCKAMLFRWSCCSKYRLQRYSWISKIYLITTCTLTTERYEVITTVITKTFVLLDMMPCSLVDWLTRTREARFFHNQLYRHPW